MFVDVFSRRHSHSGVRSEEEMVLIGWTEVVVDVPVSPSFSLSLFARTFLILIVQVVLGKYEIQKSLTR